MKRRYVVFTLILAYLSVSRLFLIDKVPPLLNLQLLTLRSLSVIAGLISTIFLYKLVLYHFKNIKIALLTIWVFSVLPWTFEQGRIASNPNYALAMILFIFLIWKKTKKKLLPFFIFLIPVMIYWSYPRFWLFNISEFKPSLDSVFTNIYVLTSFDFLFFRNITFWWGGIREFGIMLLGFAPFFLFGLYRLVISKETILLGFYGLLIIISALSPYFPESREFFLATPLISLIVALGFYQSAIYKSLIIRVIHVFIVLLLIYEISQFTHFYFIHYPGQIMDNLPKIHEAF